ncbi:hypothetical protein X992_5207 [Burkholderia pseudomallei MSHR5492]|nr:hypothetical protein X992_5207 [Burkholderia pseudomallei MSHR5492]
MPMPGNKNLAANFSWGHFWGHFFLGVRWTVVVIVVGSSIPTLRRTSGRHPLAKNLHAQMFA